MRPAPRACGANPCSKQKEFYGADILTFARTFFERRSREKD